MRNPVMFVVEVGSVLTTILFFTRPRLVDAERERLHRTRRAVPLVHRAVRQLRRSGRRRPRQGAGRHAPQDPSGDDGEPPACRRHHRGVPGTQLDLGDECVVVGGRGDPERRRRDRGHRERRRVGDHRRVGAGHPRVRRRPLGGHRRHTGPLRPDRRADHRPAGRDVHRPDDRARRGLRRARRPRTRSRSTSCSPGSRSSSCSRPSPCSRSRSSRTPSSRSSSSSRCWCASSRRRSARCSRPSASRAWTGWCGATCSR